MLHSPITFLFFVCGLIIDEIWFSILHLIVLKFSINGMAEEVKVEMIDSRIEGRCTEAGV